MKKTLVVSLFAVLQLFSLSNVLYSSDEAGSRVTILYTNSANNVLKACGCPGNPFGGLAQRAYIIDQYRKKNPGVVLIDSGDMFGTSNSSHAMRKSNYLVKIYNLMHYSIINIGDQEFAYGADYVKKLINERKLPFISSNIHDSKSGKLLAYPYRIFETSGASVAVIGIVHPKAFFFTPKKNKENIEVRDYNDKLKIQVSYLRKKADVVVLVSHHGYDRDIELAKKIKGVDLIVGGHSQHLLRKPEKVGSTLIVQAGKEGEYLGEVTFILKDNKITGYTHHLNPLTEQIPEDPQVAAVIKEYDEIIVGEMKKSPIKLPEKKKAMIVWDHYEKAETCMKCHNEIYDSWKKTPHSHALETIKKSGRQYDPECLYCHTTGYGRKNGFKTVDKTPDKGGVQCASCHEIDPVHFEDPKKGNTKRISKRLCLSCHSEEKSPEYDYGEYLKKVRH